MKDITNTQTRLKEMLNICAGQFDGVYSKISRFDTHTCSIHQPRNSLSCERFRWFV